MAAHSPPRNSSHGSHPHPSVFLRRGGAQQKKAPSLIEAFAPSFVRPPSRFRPGGPAAAAASAGRATARAVKSLAQERGISTQEAGQKLIKVREQISVRNRTLREVQARAPSLSPAQALGVVGLKTDVPKELLAVRRNRFVTPEGEFEVTSIPGLTLERKKIRPPARPGRARPVRTPTPTRR